MADAFRVPAELEPLFQRAQAYVREYFGELSADPAEGAVRFHGERYIRVRAASISIGFFDIVRTVYRGHRDPDEVAAALLYDVAHALGASDARRFADAMGVSEPLEVLSAGPVHFAFAGWALVDLHPDSRPVPDSSFLLAYDHPNSFEAEAWMDAGRKATRPVCVMNAGYSSGWCEAAFGLPLVAREVECRARGHAACRFVMATPERIDERVRERHGPLAPSALPGIFELVRRHEEELARAHRMETVGRVAGAVAHDFNNLLTVMSGHAQQLADALPSGSEGARSAAAILDAADRATALTARLLSLADPSSIEPVPIDLADLVRDLTPVLNGLVGDTIALLTRVPKEAWALGSPAVERVVIELVMSAREALRDGGQMSVRVLREADRWAVQVEDDGNSSSREPWAGIATPRAGALGFGLASAARLAQKLGGELVLTTLTGGGNRAVLLLPATRPPAPPRPPSPLGDAHLLVVEDDALVGEMLLSYLQLRGVRVTLARDVGSAAEAARADRVDLVLSDVILGRARGPDAVDAVKALHPGIGVLYMTGYDDGGLPPGAGVLRKPFDLDTLLATLRELL